MSSEPPSIPKYIGLQWFLIGWLMIVVPIWTIINNLYSNDELWGISVFSSIVVVVGMWVLYNGIELIRKYDISQ